MDAGRFDTLARSLTTAGSRRQALAAALAGSLGLVGLRDPDDAHAAKSGKCKPKCGECQQCKKGDCDKKNGKKKCKKGKCKAKAFGTPCSVGTCQNGACVATSPPPPPLQTCTNAAECGNDTDGTMCFCRDHESGQKVCSKQNAQPGRVFPAGTACSVCQGGEQCFLINGGAGGIECILPCRA